MKETNERVRFFFFGFFKKQAEIVTAWFRKTVICWGNKKNLPYLRAYKLISPLFFHCLKIAKNKNKTLCVLYECVLKRSWFD